MEKIYKFRAYPNKKQKEQIIKTFGCTRFVYNHYLAKQMESYQENKNNRHLSWYDMCNDLPNLKQKYVWLKEVDAVALQQKLRDLDNAWKKYFLEMKKPGYVRYSEKRLKHFKEIGHIPTLYDSAWHPKFKKKSKHRFSYTTQNNHQDRKTQAIMFANKKIKIQKLGWVRIKDKYVPQGKILHATIEQTPSGKYYIYICCTDIEKKSFPKTFKQIGIDMGINYFCSYSDGNKELNPNFTKKAVAKINRLQRELQRKTSGGSNWNKTRLKLAKAYEKLTNQKMDYLQKLTTNLVKQYDDICIENLAIQEMIVTADGKTNKIKTNKRNAISSCSWYEFARQLEYKTDWYDKKLYKVNRFYPSSQICHICGYKNKNTKDESIREWTCPSCGIHHDRDVNAAINILIEGLKQKTA